MLKVKNLMEDSVSSMLDDVLKRYPRCCNCDQCKMDIMAIALNNLPPRYVSTDRGDVIARSGSMDFSVRAKVIEERAKAIAIVEEHPRHERS